MLLQADNFRYVPIQINLKIFLTTIKLNIIFLFRVDYASENCINVICVIAISDISDLSFKKKNGKIYETRELRQQFVIKLNDNDSDYNMYIVYRKCQN